MKRPIYLLLPFLSLFLFTNGCRKDTKGNPPVVQADTTASFAKQIEEKGYYSDPKSNVSIYFEVPESEFPESWMKDPVNGKSTPVASDEVDRCKNVTQAALDKYHPDVVKWNLKKLFWVQSLEFFGVAYGGTNSTENLYLVNDGELNGYSDQVMEASFHHEFSSILLRNYDSYFDLEEWKLLNPEGFIYRDERSDSDIDGGASAIADGEASEEFSPELAAIGFLNQYSKSSYENDLNEIVQNLFAPEVGFWKLIEEHPAFARKVDFVIDFYHKIWEGWTREVFNGYAEL